MMNLNLNTVVNRVRDRVEQYRGTDLERKVKEATSSESWGVKSSIKEEIARATHDYSGYREVMPIVWRRMSESGKNWRMVFKSLDLLDYLLKRGSERVISEARVRQYQIRTLRDFHFTGPDGRDLGAGVREKSIALCELLNSDELLKKERKIASDLHKRFAGINAGNSIGNNNFSSFDSGYGADPRYTSNSFGDAEDSYDLHGDERRKKKKEKDKKKKKKKKKDIAYDVDRENENSQSDGSLSDTSEEEHGHHRSKRHNKKKDNKKASSSSTSGKAKKGKKRGSKKKDDKKVSDETAARLEPHPRAATQVPDLLGGPPAPFTASGAEPIDLFASTTPAADGGSFFHGDSVPTVVSGPEDEWAFGSDFVGASSPKSTSAQFSPLAVPASTPASKPPASASTQRDDLIDFSAFSAASPPAQPAASTTAPAIFDAFSPDFETADQALADPLGLSSATDSAPASTNKPAEAVQAQPQNKPADACWDSNLVDLGNLSLGSATTSSSNSHPQIALSNKPQMSPSLSTANASLYGLPQQSPQPQQQQQLPNPQTNAFGVGVLPQNYQPSQPSSVNFGFDALSPMQQSQQQSQQPQMQQAMFGGMSPNSQQSSGQPPQQSPLGGNGFSAYAWQGQENPYNF